MENEMHWIDACLRLQKHTRLLLRASSNDHNVRLAGLLVRSRPHARPRAAAVRRIAQITHLGFQKFRLGVYHDELAADGVEEKCVCKCGADIAAAQNGDAGLKPVLRNRVWRCCA